MIRLMWIFILVVLGCQSCKTSQKVKEQNEKKPSCNRIVSLAPNITETVFALGIGDRLIGVTSYCAFPKEAKTKQVVASYIDPNYELLAELKPDIVFLLEHHEQVEKKLAGLGIQSKKLRSEDIEGLLSSIKILGDMCGVQDRAEALTSSIGQRLRAIDEKTKDLPKPRVLISVGRNMGSGSIKDIYAASSRSLFEELLSVAGGKNAFEGKAIDYARMSAEGVLALNPDIIVDLAAGVDKKGISKKDIKAEWNIVSQTNAVKNDRVYVLTEDYVVIPGPRIVLLVEEMARLFHPGVDWN